MTLVSLATPLWMAGWAILSTLANIILEIRVYAQRPFHGKFSPYPAISAVICFHVVTESVPCVPTTNREGSSHLTVELRIQSSHSI